MSRVTQVACDSNHIACPRLYHSNHVFALAGRLANGEMASELQRREDECNESRPYKILSRVSPLLKENPSNDTAIVQML